MAGDDLTAATCAAIVLYIAIKQRRRRQKKRTVWIREWMKKRQQYGAYQHLVKELRLSDSNGYKKFLRMDPESFGVLESLITPLITKKDTNMRRSIPAGERLAVTVRFLATGL